VALAGHKEEGKKKDTPAPVWAGACTRRLGSERRQTGWRSHQSDTELYRVQYCWTKRP